MACTGPLAVGKNGMMDTTKDLVLGGSPCLYLGCDPMKNPTFKLWLVLSVVPTVLSMGILKQPDIHAVTLSPHVHCTDACLAPTGDPLSHLWPWCLSVPGVSSF